MIYKAYLRGLAESSQKSLGDPVLPSGFGKRLPERVVELLLARLSYNPGKKVLDVGHAYIMDCHRQLVTSLPAPRHLTGIDIADPTYNTQSVYERSLKADITNSGLPDNSFDLIWCISTLEHLGMDNSGYTPSFAMGDHMAAQALREMLRLVAPGGHVLITVPFGKFENHGWFMNLDRDRWQSLLSIAKPYASVTECYFHHTAAAGWSRVNAEELSNVGYYDEQNAGAAALAVAYITKTSGE
jgi:SAM-dependent methyltransferase